MDESIGQWQMYVAEQVDVDGGERRRRWASGCS